MNIYKSNVSRLIFLIFVFFSSLSYSQDDTSLPEGAYEAWTVEWTPYKIAIQDAISKYLLNKIKDKIDIPDLKLSDRIIIIRSLINKGEIYSIWYGTGYGPDGFTKLNREEVEWIFGYTLRKTLLERDAYHNLDTRLVSSKKTNQNELDYLYNIQYWSLNDYDIEFPRKISFKILDSYRFVGQWGDETLGLPYGAYGAIKTGIRSKYFEVGVQMPSIIQWENGIINKNDDSSLISGFGGYGGFNSELGSAYLAFSSYPTITKNINLENVKYIDFSFIYSKIFELPIKTLIPFYKGTIQISPGFYTIRVSNGEISNDTTLINLTPSAKYINNTYSFIPDSTQYISGVYMKVEGVGSIPKNRNYPRYYWIFQLTSGLTSLFKVNININSYFGINATYTISHDKANSWNVKDALYFGINWHYSLNE